MKTHCKRGHPRTESSVQWSIGSSGKRQGSCKECRLIRERERYATRVEVREARKARSRRYKLECRA
jgi:hypothetical protein